MTELRRDESVARNAQFESLLAQFGGSRQGLTASIIGVFKHDWLSGKGSLYLSGVREVRIEGAQVYPSR
jgi:hypothetical protein